MRGFRGSLEPCNEMVKPKAPRRSSFPREMEWKLLQQFSVAKIILESFRCNNMEAKIDLVQVNHGNLGLFDD